MRTINIIRIISFFIFLTTCGFSGTFTVLTATPNGDVRNIKYLKEIKIVFSKPMVALGRTKKTIKIPQITFNPPIEGNYRWSSTDTLIFKLESQLPLSTAFKGQIAATLKSVDGSTLYEPYTWEFNTPRAYPVRIQPGNRYNNIDPDQNIVIYFDQEIAIKGSSKAIKVTTTPNLPDRSYDPHNLNMDIYEDSPELEAAAMEYLDELKNNEDVITSVKYRISYGHSNEYHIQQWKMGQTREKPEYGAIDKKILVIEPLESLPRSTTVSIDIQESIQPLQGNLPNKAKKSIFYTTHRFFIKDVFDGMINPRWPGYIYFSSSVSWHDLKNHLFLSQLDDLDNKKVVKTIFHPQHTSDNMPRWYTQQLNIDSSFKLLPSTPYRLTLLKDAVDKYSNKLPATFTYYFKTGNYPAFMNLSTGESVVENCFPQRIKITGMNVKNVDRCVKKVSPTDLTRYFKAMQKSRLDFDHDKLDLDSKVNKYFSHLETFDTSGADGIYFYAYRRGACYPDSLYNSGKPYWQKGLLQFTSLAIGAKIGYRGTLVYVSDISNNSPIKDADVYYIDCRNNNVIKKTTTDKMGFATGPGYDSFSRWPGFYIAVVKGDRCGYLRSQFSKQLYTWNFGIYPEEWQNPDINLTYLITDRGVYRQGDEVYIKGIVRDIKDEKFKMPANAQVTLTVTDRNRNTVISTNMTLSEFGSFDLSFALPKDCSLGTYRVSCSYDGRGHQDTFLVTQYRPVKFRNSVSVDSQDKVTGDTALFTSRGSYLYGAPMKDCQVKWFLESSSTSFTPKVKIKNDSIKNWYFAHTAYYQKENPRYASSKHQDGTGRLDANGVFKIKLPLDHQTFLDPRRYVFEAEISDVDNQTVAGRTSKIVHPAEFYLGIKREGYFIDAKKGLTTAVMAVTPGGKKLADKNVKLKLTKVVWKSVKKKNLNNSYYVQNTVIDKIISETYVTTSSESKQVKFRLKDGGYYILRAESSDAKNRQVISSFHFYAYGENASSWMKYDGDYIEVLPEKEVVKPGETVKLLVKSPYESCEGLLTIERGKVLEKRLIKIKSHMHMIDLKIKESHIPNIYVSVVLMKGRTGFEVTEDHIDKDRPVIKLGYTTLTVIPDRVRLLTTIQTDKDTYAPRDKVTINVTTLKHDKKPEKAEVAIFAVDEAVINLIGYKPKDPLKFFYTHRNLGVKTLDNRPYILEHRFFGSKGQEPGGGGGEEEGGPSVRSDFRVTPYWCGSLVTSDKGTATTSFTLPDNLTSFKIFAVANSRQRFGSGETAITVRKDLILKPAFPRFTVVGDKFIPGVSAHNLSKEDGVLTVTVKNDKYTSFSEGGGSRSAIKLKAGDITNIPFKMKATAKGEASFTVSGTLTTKSGVVKDAFLHKIPVIVPKVTETVAAYGVLKKKNEKRTEKVRYPEGVYPDVGGLSVQLSSTLLEDLDLPLKYVYNYPYGCAEQTTSRLFASLVRLRLQKDFGSKNADYKVSDEEIKSIIRYLYSFQNSDGGLGFWPTSRYSYPWATAYVINVLAEAEKQGLAVDSSFKRRAINYLDRKIKEKEDNKYYSMRFHVSSKVFMLLALAKHGTYISSMYEYLMSSMDDMCQFTKAQFMQVLAIHNRSRYTSQIATLQRSLLNNATVEGGYTFFKEGYFNGQEHLLHSDDRSTAIILSALISADPESVLIPRILRYLYKVRKNGRWNNTQENVYVIQAILDYYQSVEKEVPAFISKVSLDGKPLLEKNFQGRSFDRAEKKIDMIGLKTYFKDKKEVDYEFSKSGPGVLYYTTRLTYAPLPETFEAMSKGITISKKYFHAENGKEATVYEAGDLIKVVLTYDSPSARNFIVIDDPIPAGTEILDKNLKTTTKAALKDTGSARQRYGWFWTGFNFEAVHDHKINVFADRLEAGTHTYTYMIRATTPGQYTAAAGDVKEMYFPEIFGTMGPVEITIK